jgi:ABC-type multidrug transport system fused ATPase/permease subunit
LYKGKVVEQGSHEELIGKNAMYFKLIANQLSIPIL